MSRRLQAALCAVLLIACGAFNACFNYLDSYEVGLTWNVVTGETALQNRAGWHRRAPWVLVSKIDTRPQRVCITSAAHAGKNCKLVQFVPVFYREFVATEGFRWYWWSNRFSYNSGYPEEYRGFRDVLRGYAFSAQQYPFVRVLKDYQES